MEKLPVQTIVFCLFLVVIVAVVLYNWRLRGKKRSLPKQTKEQEKPEKTNEGLPDKPAVPDESGGREKNPGKTSGDLLYARFRELMKDPGVFTNPSINRRVLADKLGTNERYVSDTIRKHYGMSVSDYITTLRLEHAHALLSGSERSRTIEDIALDSGFKNRFTFLRNFKERYGMTPDEFRKSLAGDEGPAEG